MFSIRKKSFPLISLSSCSISLLSDIKEFLEENEYLEESMQLVNNIIIARTEQTIISSLPLVKYPKEKAEQYKSDYPRLTEYLQNEIPKIANNDEVINSIHNLTNAPIETIKEALKWGKGPEIKIIQLGGEGDSELYGSYRGHIIPSEINTLFLDVDLVNDLENLENEQEFTDAMAFLIAVTILHEYNHLGDTVFGNSFWGDLHVESGLDEDEVGIIFETEIFGEAVWRSNVGVIILKGKL